MRGQHFSVKTQLLPLQPSRPAAARSPSDAKPKPDRVRCATTAMNDRHS